MQEQVSAGELLDRLTEYKDWLASQSSELYEGNARVLEKLRERRPDLTYKRVWLRSNEGFCMWDLMTDEELSARSYREADAQSYHVSYDRPALSDTVTYWTSDMEPGEGLWVGLPLLK